MFFLCIFKCLKFHQLNNIKIIKKDFKKSRERYQSLSKEEQEKKSYTMVVSDTKIYQKKNKILLSTGKKIIR